MLARGKKRALNGCMNNNIFTVEKENGVVEWNLNSECRRVVQRIANEFGMSIEQFLTLYTRGRLPAQLVRGDEIDQENPPPGFAVIACEDRLIWNRIRRAARFMGTSVREDVWQSIASLVNDAEEHMLLSPKTGEPIDVRDLEGFVIRRELHAM